MVKRIMLGIKGFIVGATMLIPGVSGGSMAIILGIYDELISSVSSFFKDKKKSLIFLGIFLAGSVAGILIFSKPVSMLLESFPKQVMYFFIGAVAGSVPMIFRKAKVTRFTWKQPLYIAAGVACVAGVSLLPVGLVGGGHSPFVDILLTFAAGIIAAIALILPGISISHMLLMLGIYDRLLLVMAERDVSGALSLLPLVIGLLAGVILFTRLMENIIEKHTEATYITILGFLIGSLIDVFPGLPYGGEIPVCILLFAVGFSAIYFLSRKDKG